MLPRPDHTVYLPYCHVQEPEVILLCGSIGEVTNTTGHAAPCRHARATDPMGGGTWLAEWPAG